MTVQYETYLHTYKNYTLNGSSITKLYTIQL